MVQCEIRNGRSSSSASPPRAKHGEQVVFLCILQDERLSITGISLVYTAGILPVSPEYRVDINQDLNAVNSLDSSCCPDQSLEESFRSWVWSTNNHGLARR
jgi:hypothetical protein